MANFSSISILALNASQHLEVKSAYKSVFSRHCSHCNYSHVSRIVWTLTCVIWTAPSTWNLKWTSLKKYFLLPFNHWIWKEHSFYRIIEVRYLRKGNSSFNCDECQKQVYKNIITAFCNVSTFKGNQIHFLLNLWVSQLLNTSLTSPNSTSGISFYVLYLPFFQLLQ